MKQLAIILHSNTTLVKVKSISDILHSGEDTIIQIQLLLKLNKTCLFVQLFKTRIQIQLLLKLNSIIFSLPQSHLQIQIQLLLKLNLKKNNSELQNLYSNTTLVKVK